MIDFGLNWRYSRVNTEPEEETMKILDAFKNDGSSMKKIFKSRNSKEKTVKGYQPRYRKRVSQSFIDLAM